MGTAYAPGGSPPPPGCLGSSHSPTAVPLVAMVSDLQVKTSPRPQSRLALEVVVPAERCQRSYSQALRKLCRTVRLPGFRPGRIPQTVLLQQLGTRQVWTVALEQLLEDTVQEVLNDKELAVVGKLQLQDQFEALAQRFKPSESLTLAMEADVHPTATLKSYQDLEVEVEELSQDGLLEQALEQQRRSASTLVPLEKTTAEAGDVAVVKLFVQHPENRADDGGNGTDDELASQELEVDLVEDQTAMPMIVPMILGMSVGETKMLPRPQVDQSQGEETDQQEPEGEEPEVAITLSGLKERQLPELDDGFAQKVSRHTTMGELHHALSQEIETQVKEGNQQRRHDALLQVLCDHLEVDLPQSMVEKEVNTVMEEYKDKLREGGQNPDLQLSGPVLKQLEEASLKKAHERLHRNLALDTVAQAENLQVPDDELQEREQRLLRLLNSSQTGKIDRGKLRTMVKTDLLREKALTWLEEHNTFKVSHDSTSTPDPGHEGTESVHPAADPAL